LRNDSTCYDTIIKRCFKVIATPTLISLTAKKSCTTIGNTDIKVTVASGLPAYTYSLYSPAGVVLQTVTTAASSLYVFNIFLACAAGLKYKVVAADQCGNKDSAVITPLVSIVNPVHYYSKVSFGYLAQWLCRYIGRSYR
jgi:hypothetical protein